MESTRPKTLSRTLNTILLTWENVIYNNLSSNKYILQMANDFKEWKTIYWGAKTKLMVSNLGQCTCYAFRLKLTSGESDEWIYFKSGTDGVPYFVLHFTRAVKFGKTSVIRKIITRRHVLLETGNKEGKTPLMQATESGNLQMVTFLLNLGASVNMPTVITKRTPLMVALFNNNLQISNLLIDRGANLEDKDCNLLTALHHAVDSNICENVELCLNHEFDIDAQDNKGWTPLLRAVILECRDEIISLLLNKGANPSIKDKNGYEFFDHLKLCNREYLGVLVCKKLEETSTATIMKSIEPEPDKGVENQG